MNQSTWGLCTPVYKCGSWWALFILHVLSLLASLHICHVSKWSGSSSILRLILFLYCCPWLPRGVVFRVSLIVWWTDSGRDTNLTMLRLMTRQEVHCSDLSLLVIRTSRNTQSAYLVGIWDKVPVQTSPLWSFIVTNCPWHENTRSFGNMIWQISSPIAFQKVPWFYKIWTKIFRGEMSGSSIFARITLTLSSLKPIINDALFSASDQTMYS